MFPFLDRFRPPRPSRQARTIPLFEQTRTRYPPNIVRNQKYNVVTFVPMVLYEQFKFFFNLYFLLVALSQFIPSLKIGYLMTYFAPLVFVLVVSLSKEAWDDFKRYKRDQEANSQAYQKWDRIMNAWKWSPSSDIAVGDLILIEKNQRVPSDCILLKTTETTGSCFIRTDQLDGETDWKLRIAIPYTQKIKDDTELTSLRGHVTCEQPHKDIHSFAGNFTVENLDSDNHDGSNHSNHITGPPLMIDDDFGSNINHRSSVSSSASSLIDGFINSSDPITAGPINLNEGIEMTHVSTHTASDEHTEPVSVDNMLWANTVVASGLATGYVVYTGIETRAVMNTSTPHTKVGLIDIEINKLSKILAALTLVLSLIMVAFSEFRGVWYVNVVRFLILFSSIIPISLRVNLDFAKTFYSMEIMGDDSIRDTVVRTSSIPEELARIEYLLSDKTGTLTKNIMELRKIHLGSMSFSLDSMQQLKEITNSAFNNALPGGAFKIQRSRDVTARVRDVLIALGVCHNVTPVIDEDEDENSDDVVVGVEMNSGGSRFKDIEDDTIVRRGPNITYQASSPDEVAIVEWIAKVGLQLYYRDRTTIKLLPPALDESLTSKTAEIKNRRASTMKFLDANGMTGNLLDQAKKDRLDEGLLEFEVLDIFPFTSESKRMGIIVRDKSTGDITFYQKGADTIMMKIVEKNDWLEEECGNMAREGLRTLVFGRRKLSQTEYTNFKNQYEQAKRTLIDRVSNMQNVIEKCLESNLELLGLTGVEDKLQDDVKNSLEMLRNAGLKIWMLTGDKIETATCIALSSKLVGRNQTIRQVSGLRNEIDAMEEIERLRAAPGDCCLVIDGQSLHVCLDQLRHEFISVAVTLPAVVCCRVSPTQKADVTRLIKEFTGRRTCAIGDGGNDVSMIQAAHVGVGIVGKEGKQASLAADFSVQQFSYLPKLLLCHGRNSYKRSAKLVQVIIHRGLVISIMQAIFSAFFLFAPVALYQGLTLVGFSTVYTMAAVFSLVLDKDVRDDTALLYPELYQSLRKGRSLSMKTFLLWVLISVFQGGVLMLAGMEFAFDGKFSNFVAVTFTALVAVELLVVSMEVNTWHNWIWISILVSFMLYIMSVPALIENGEFSPYIMQTLAFWLNVSMLTVAAAWPLFVGKWAKKMLSPPTYTKLEG